MRHPATIVCAAILSASAAVAVANARQNQATAQGAEKLSFDVASIHAGATVHGPVGVQFSPGRIVAECTNLRALVFYAYHLTFAVPLTGLPSWGNAGCGATANADAFSVEATMPENTTDEQARLMMQSLLAERFHLQVHWEKKNMAVMNLVVREGGFKGKPAGAKDDAPNQKYGCPQEDPRCHMIIGLPTPAVLAGFLTSFVGKPVIDQTGLAGPYNLTLFWASDTSPNSPLPSLPAALRESFNLELKPGTGPVDCLIVDHVEKPTAN
jgi:uncharacterized protein (TIGR03435 family)